jgi:hypothetical protein
MEQHVLTINTRINARVAFTFFSNPNLVSGQGEEIFHHGWHECAPTASRRFGLGSTGSLPVLCGSLSKSHLEH